MAADKVAFTSPIPASLQTGARGAHHIAHAHRSLLAPFSNTLRVILSILITSGGLVQAADLPRTFSDAATTGDVIAAPAAGLQTGRAVLPVDAAFKLTTFIEAEKAIVLKWEMPPGYYLYQKSLVVENAVGAVIDLELPEAETTTDEFFGEVAVYHESLLLRVPFAMLDVTPGATLDLMLTYQGCAEALYCYPPEHKALTLTLPE